jgi:hypothetical protein
MVPVACDVHDADKAVVAEIALYPAPVGDVASAPPPLYDTPVKPLGTVNVHVPLLSRHMSTAKAISAACASVDVVSVSVLTPDVAATLAVLFETLASGVAVSGGHSYAMPNI